LRKRLRNLPAAYEFAILTMMHELGEVCARIVQNMTPGGIGSLTQSAIYMDFHAMAFRGIVIGIHSLAYHGFGLDAAAPRPTVAKLLDRLRSDGPMTRRNFLRKFQDHSAESRDRLLGLLAAEGIIRIDNNSISPVPLGEFIQALHDRPEFAEPKFLCPRFLKI
jgi:hypothetical protein